MVDFNNYPSGDSGSRMAMTGTATPVKQETVATKIDGAIHQANDIGTFIEDALTTKLQPILSLNARTSDQSMKEPSTTLDPNRLMDKLDVLTMILSRIREDLSSLQSRVQL